MTKDTQKIISDVINYFENKGYDKEILLRKIQNVVFYEYEKDVDTEVNFNYKGNKFTEKLNSSEKLSFRKRILSRYDSRLVIIANIIGISKELDENKFKQRLIYELVHVLSQGEIDYLTETESILKLGITSQIYENQDEMIKTFYEIKGISNINEGIATYTTYKILRDVYKEEPNIKIMKYHVYSKVIDIISQDSKNYDLVLNAFLIGKKYKWINDFKDILGIDFEYMTSLGNDLFTKKYMNLLVKYKLRKLSNKIKK